MHGPTLGYSYEVPSATSGGAARATSTAGLESSYQRLLAQGSPRLSGAAVPPVNPSWRRSWIAHLGAR